jgi:alkylhydroperoxidase/carboxymuconolactone decarboxylase family protein YurZ
MTDWAESYREMFGFVPGFVEVRQAEQGALHPEFVDALERLRLVTFANPALDDVTKQLIAFAVLVSHIRPAALNHAVGARRAGATWEQINAAAEIGAMLGALGPGNRVGELLRDARAQEA